MILSRQSVKPVGVVKKSSLIVVVDLQYRKHGIKMHKDANVRPGSRGCK